MGLSPYKAGDGSTWYNQQFTTDSGIFPLAGRVNSDITLHMQDRNTTILYVCTGTWEIRDTVNSKADFTPSAQDITTGYLGRAGSYNTYPVVSMGTYSIPMDAQIVEVIYQP